MEKRSNFKTESRQQQSDAARVATEVRPIVSKDSDWSLVTGKKKQMTRGDWIREKRAITRITKKAVRAMYPGYAVSVRSGRGTAHHWVYIDVTMPELNDEKVRNTSREWEYKDVCRRIEDTLLALGIKYGIYESDCGPNSSPSPCLLVSVNHAF